MQVANRDRLKRFIESDAESLANTLRYYVLRAGICRGQDAADVAADLLNDVVVEALENAERFIPTASPKAWLLGIAANLIKRRQVGLAKRSRREPLIGDMYAHLESKMSEEELFERFTSLAAAGPSDKVESREFIDAMLSRVSETDREVLRLAVLHTLDGERVANALGINPGAARVRLHRAIKRLREAISQDERG